MPQELALMPTMTVSEHFQYYGQLSEMNPREIGKRSLYLVDLLQIPAADRPVEKLSGGQQRRTSLALTLLHSPPLLILDEPTVGIDPVLRNKIWSYLQELTMKEGKTVILTTHYIEEARNANTIALMRYGSLLAEANPDRLLATFRMSTIEEVFLNLCEKGDSEESDQTAAVAVAPPQPTTTAAQPKQGNLNKLPKDGVKPSRKCIEENIIFAPYNGRRPTNNLFNWLRVWAIICDTFTFIQGKVWTILVACLLPTCQIYLFHYSIGKPIASLPIAVSSPENGRSSRFSDVLINRLEARNITVERFVNGSSAVDAVTNGLAFASFKFDSNFTRCLVNRIRRGYEVSPYDIDCSRVKMAPDNTYQFIIFQLALDLRDSFLEAIYRYFPKLGYNPEALNSPVVVKEYVYGSDKFSYQEFMTPGMYMALIYLAPLIVTLFVLLEQKVYRHVERSQAAGARPLEILAAHFVTNGAILVIQTGFMMVVSLLYFEAQVHGSVLLLLAIVYLEGVAGIALAILMATVLDNKLAALVFVYGLTISLWMICGVFWPTENINFAVARQSVQILPLTWPIETARNIMNRGWSIDHTYVMLGFGSATFYAVVPMLLSYVVFK